jgi:hypothetical protein
LIQYAQHVPCVRTRSQCNFPRQYKRNTTQHNTPHQSIGQAGRQTTELQYNTTSTSPQLESGHVTSRHVTSSDDLDPPLAIPLSPRIAIPRNLGLALPLSILVRRELTRHGVFGTASPRALTHTAFLLLALAQRLDDFEFLEAGVLQIELLPLRVLGAPLLGACCVGVGGEGVGRCRSVCFVGERVLNWKAARPWVLLRQRRNSASDQLRRES